MILRNIPNFVTLLNLLCGCFAVQKATSGDPVTAAYLIGAAALFDFADGFTARLLKAYSPMGKELDSLADVVSFGVAPAMIAFHMLSAGGIGEGIEPAYFSFMLPLFAAWRLAKFNVDTRQTDSFRGLPTPAAGITVASLPLLIRQYPEFNEFIVKPVFLLSSVGVISLLMVLPIPLFALKFKTYNFSGNIVRYVFLLSSLFLILIFRFAAAPFIVFLYISLSLIQNFGKR